MPGTSQRLILTMAATAVVLHVWAPCVRAGGGETSRETTSHVVIGLSPSTSFDVFVEDLELPGSPVVSSDTGIAVFTVDDAGFPPGPLTVRIHPTGDLVITGVEATDVTTHTAVIAWTTNLPSSSLVEYGETPAYGWMSPLDPELVIQHRVDLAGLSPGITYHFRAVSDDGQGHVSQSSDHQFTTLPDPLLITDVQVEDVGPTWAIVRWATNRPADSQVEYGLTPGYGHATPVDPAMVVDHVVTLTALTPGTLYHFRARSEDGAGQVAHSTDRVFVTPAPPLTISSLQVTEVGTTWAIIEWLTDRPASTLVAYGLTGQYGLLEDAGEGFVTEHSATLAGLAEATLYHFRAVSVDEDGAVGVSPDSTFATKEVQEVGPPAITSIAAVPRSATCVHVTWTTDRPATSQVRYGAGGVLDCATGIDTTLVTEHGVLVGPVVPSIEYSFVVLSACGGDTARGGPGTFETPRPPSSDLTERAIAIGRPGVPVVADTAVVVRWSTDRPCWTWVEWGTDVSYGAATAGWEVAHLLYEATVGGLVPETLYHYRVCAVNEQGSVSVGEDRTFETGESSDEGPPAAPAGLSGRLCDETIELSWTASGEVDLRGYFVYRARAGLEGGEWSRAIRLNESPLDDPWYVDVEVERGSAYAYTVTAVDLSWNESAQSGTVVLEFPEDPPARLQLAAFPNPASAQAWLALEVPSADCPLILRILSPSGRVVHEHVERLPEAGQRILTWRLTDSSGRPVGSGVYLCEASVGERVAREKLTVLR